MRLEWPLGLCALALVPLAALACVALERRRARYAVHFTNLEVLASCAPGSARRRSRLPALCVLLAITCSTAALARPALEMSATSERASIVLAVDTSGSMAADDVKPSRLSAAQGAIARFLARLPGRYRVGLVTFSSRPWVAAPLSWDREQVTQMLDLARPAQGTAIGDAIGRSVDLLAPLSSRSGFAPAGAGEPLSAIVLLSDGAQTRGRLGALQGAALARADGIPVYTVALGTPDGTISEGVITLKVPPDTAALGQIAGATGGAFFAPTDEASLDSVYEHLASSLGRTRVWRELGFVLVGAAALLALAAGAFSLAWSERLP
jgi:Ca-activated chloride channel family protein